MSEHAPRRTIGELAADMEPMAAAAYAGLAVVILGSIAPWATAPLGSAAGTDGDGRWTIVLAALGAVGLVRSGIFSNGAIVACVLILTFGIYDAIHIEHVVARTTFAGTQLDHVGWGVYAVIAGGAMTLAVLVKARIDERRLAR